MDLCDDERMPLTALEAPPEAPVGGPGQPLHLHILVLLGVRALHHNLLLLGGAGGRSRLQQVELVQGASIQ